MGISPDYVSQNFHIVAIKNMYGQGFDGFWPHGGIGLSYRSFHDRYGFINQLALSVIKTLL